MSDETKRFIGTVIGVVLTMIIFELIIKMP